MAIKSIFTMRQKSGHRAKSVWTEHLTVNGAFPLCGHFPGSNSTFERVGIQGEIHECARCKKLAIKHRFPVEAR